MDVDGLKAVLRGIREGSIRTLAMDLPEPSPLSHALLNSNPYTYLDDAPLEERRARAVSVRRTLPAEDARAFGALDAQAIAQVVSDARPEPRDEEELHDALLQLLLMPQDDAPAEWLANLVRSGRAARVSVGDIRFAVAAERVQHVRAVHPQAVWSPALEPLPGDGPVDRELAMVAAVRGLLEVCGPTTSAELAARLALPEPEVSQALFRLESEGQVLRGTFRAGATDTEWCDRRLLQRIHRLTVGRLRAEIQPLSAQDFMRFLFRWHRMDEPELRGKGGLLKAVSLLEGYEAPASAWEWALLPARMKGYLPELLERACWDGEVAWGRLTLRDGDATVPGPRRGSTPAPAPEAAARRVSPTRNASLTFVRRESLDWMLAAARPGGVFADGGVRLPVDLSHPAREVAEALERRGASFFQDLVSATKRLPAEIEDALWELLARGLVSADAVDNLRVLQSPKRRKRQKALRRGGPGRWSLLAPSEPHEPAALVEKVAGLMLQRYGVVWRDLAQREPLAPPWREVLRVYRRMEARGEIRGGRFVAGFMGEQYALPEAVDLARSVRRSPKSGKAVVVAAVDPLNLTGIVTPGARVPSQMGGFVRYVDGLPEGTEPIDAPAPAANG
jgi:ATP-dependent Lhr-like helicase